MDSQTQRRVKVYELNSNSEWVDQGTGQCSCIRSEIKGSFIVVRAEDSDTLLLESKIRAPSVYQRQQDTLIVWTEPDGMDLALSFQEASGCNEIWNQIDEIQAPGDDPEIFHLPTPEYANLEEIDKVVQNIFHDNRDKLINALLHEKYYLKLLEFFDMCEDLEDEAGLLHLFNIMKMILLLNDRTILDPLLKDDNIIKVIGAMEYNPELRPQPKYREYLQESVFRQPIPFTDKELEKKIHHTHRLQFLKHSVLPRGIDDTAHSALHLMTTHNQIAIISAIHSDEAFLKQLFVMLQGNVSVEKFRDGVEFIQELCVVAKPLRETKGYLYKSLCQHGLLDIVAPAVLSPDLKTRLAAISILFSLSEFDPSLLRTFILTEDAKTEDSQEDKKLLFSALVHQFVDDPDTGMKTHLAEMLRLLMDSENIEMHNASEKNDFISLFYDKYMDVLMEPLNAFLAVDQKQLSFDPEKSSLYNYLCELLCQFVQHHSYHIKSYVIRNNIISKMQILLRSKEKFLVLACIRFFRSVVKLKDDTLTGHIIQNKLFEPLFKLFETQKTKNNLVNSALLELIEFIRQENLKKLISHIVDNCAASFEGITYVDTFRLLTLKNDQNKELQNGFTASIADHTLAWANAKRKREERTMDDDEESYFSEDKEDATPSKPEEKEEEVEFNPPTKGVRIVNYDDDEESGGIFDGPLNASKPSPPKRQKVEE